MVAARSQIDNWLSERGMSKYADIFNEQCIDLGILPQLTEQHLRELGVALGDRMKILGWIVELRNGNAIPPVNRDEDGEELAAERRQVTVLFCDLVDSTGLSRRLDPEDMREVIRAYQETVSNTVRSLGGFVAGFRGDGVLVYFGYPHAHEDDAERAVRAGLGLISAVGAINSANPLKTRVGISTGLVVVGDLICEGDTQERNMVGETPNLAARLLTLAEPDSVVIADSTRALLGDFFELADLEFKQIKGFANPVRSWAVLGSRSIESRYDAMHQGLTALTGREEELEILLRRWRRAKSGDGQVVLLSGEPGIGKSRLAAALMEHVSKEPHVRLRYFCSPLHSETAFYPIISHLERAAGFEPGDNGTAKLTKLDALLDKNARSLEERALLANLCSLEDDGRYPPLSKDPQQRRQETLKALTALLFHHAAHKPVLMILEDVHWIDPTSLEAFSAAIEGIRKLPFLFLITFRPEFSAPWAGQSHVSSVSLKRLEQREITTFIELICESSSLSAGVQAQIAERSDGIPLFIEEMTRAALESLRPITADQTVTSNSVLDAEIPSSLQASLLARLDRLGPARPIAQAGAVIGRSFSHALLTRVVPEPPVELDRALDRLVESGLLFQQGLPPNATYFFKHALIRDAAYGTLLREPRRALHRRVLEALERLFPDYTESQPALLAHHATEAGLTEKAAGLWGKAGLISIERSALEEAIAQLTRALIQIAQVPSTRDLRSREIEFQVALANATLHWKGYTAPETKKAFERAGELVSRANELGEPLVDPLFEFAPLYGRLISQLVDYHRDAALHLADSFLTIAKQRESKLAVVAGHRLMGATLLYAGELVRAKPYLDFAIVQSKTIDRQLAARRFGHDPLSAALSYRSLALKFFGFPDNSDLEGELAIEEARELHHVGTILQALTFRALSHLYSGEYFSAAENLEESFKLSAEKGTAHWRDVTSLLQGVSYCNTGREQQGLVNIAAALPAWLEAGNVFGPYFTMHSAYVHARLRQFEEARAHIANALRIAEAKHEDWSTSEIHRVAGEIETLALASTSSEAEPHFQRALEIARSQSAKMLELRAAKSLARLWRDQGKPREARDLLSPIYNWFTEGFETLDLKQAKALLDELALELSTD